MPIRRAARMGRWPVLALALSALIGLAAPAKAQIGSGRYAAIVLDHRSGQVLHAANADETRHPASLTKMMTLFMLFEALEERRVTLESRIHFSDWAAARPPSKLGIGAGGSISVEQAILALVTRSANDVAAAVGEFLGGSEPRFGQLMTMKARSIGMSRTTFRNASGLPDPDQVTTARDMATLGRRLMQEFPQYYHYFGVTEARFGGMSIRNHNRMLISYDGVDGIKTGYIHASGFNIVTSATRGGQRVVGAVFGGSSWLERDQHMASLLDAGFDRLGAPGSMVAARGAGLLVRSAEAAPLRIRPVATAAAQRVRRPAPAVRRAAHRPAASRRAPVRVEQGSAARVSRPAAKPPIKQPARSPSR
jgi:D-alanyl-D-alanine carboxypeptidase